MRSYKQLNRKERVQIAHFKQSGDSITTIAKKLARSKSTISRELSCILKYKTAEETTEKMLELLKELPEQARKSITFDNGGEFAKHDVVAQKLGIKTFFCDPYASWQKGGVEHANGRLRRDRPRWMNLKNMDKEDFDEIIENYNSTPRKKLNWDSPFEAFNKNLNRVALHT